MKLISNDAVRNYIPIERQEIKKILLGINKVDTDGRRFQQLQSYGRAKMAEVAFQNLNGQFPMNFSSVDGMTACYLLGALDAEKIIAQELGRRELESILNEDKGQPNSGSVDSGEPREANGG